MKIDGSRIVKREDLHFLVENELCATLVAFFIDDSLWQSLTPR